MQGTVEQLEVKLGGLRHNVSKTIVGPDGKVTSLVTGVLSAGVEDYIYHLGHTVNFSLPFIVLPFIYIYYCEFIVLT